VHRIGRTGRAGRAGQAISLVSPDELDLLRNIERLVQQRIAPQVLPGYEPSPHAAAEARQARAPGRGGPSAGRSHRGSRR
jgi:ATP-dependent RNA helicase RhlE